MMIKVYEVSCDYCGVGLNHYIGKKPTIKELENEGYIVTKDKVFCNKRCLEDYNHDRLEKQYLNLKQNGKIHNNG